MQAKKKPPRTDAMRLIEPKARPRKAFGLFVSPNAHRLEGVFVISAEDVAARFVDDR